MNGPIRDMTELNENVRSKEDVEYVEDDRDREDEEEDTEQVLFDVSSSRRSTVISIQPHLKDPDENRIPLPITVSRSNYGPSQVLPLSGLQLLYDVSKLRIQQTYDIDYLTAGLTSENRYVIRNGDQEHGGDSLLGCCETSSSWQRLLCGTRRRFNLTLMDQTHQEAATFHRRLASSIPQLGTYLQRMDVCLPGGEYIGSVEQEWSPGYPNFTVRDAKRDILYIIRANNCWTCDQIDFVFYILNAGDSEVLSHISHEWDRDLVDYNLSVMLPPTQSVKSKALIVAAAFLFEYMYFLPGKEAGCFKSCCK